MGQLEDRQRYDELGEQSSALVAKHREIVNEANALVDLHFPPIPPAPTAVIQPVAPVEVGETVAFTATVKDGAPPLQYAWKLGDGTTGVGLSGTHAYATAGAYEVEFTALDALGRVATAPQTVTVNPKAPTVDIGPDRTVEVGQSVTFTATVKDGKPPFTYTWSRNGIDHGTNEPVLVVSTGALAASIDIGISVEDSLERFAFDDAKLTVTAPTPTPTPTGNLMLLTPERLAKVKDMAARNDPQWTTLKTSIDAILPQLQPGGNDYQGSHLIHIANLGLAYQVYKDTDPALAAKYADKALALVYGATHEYQRGSWTMRIVLGRGDGVNRVFRLPHANAKAPINVFFDDVHHIAKVRGSGPTDTGHFYDRILKISNTLDGPEDYTRDVEYLENPRWTTQGNNVIDWSPPGRSPAPGATYYYTTVQYLDASRQTSGFTIAGDTITFAVAPPATKAVLASYIFGDHFEQTSANDGGVNNCFIDSTYITRSLKYVALGLNWLQGHPRLTQEVIDDTAKMLVAWCDYIKVSGYKINSAASNYGMGHYCLRAWTAVALKAINHPEAARLMTDVLNWRAEKLLPTLTNSTTSLKGGFWPEGENYGGNSRSNMSQAALALEGSVAVNPAEERAFASETIRWFLAGSPQPGEIYNGGDWFSQPGPAPFPGAGTLTMLAEMADEPHAKGYANLLLDPLPLTADWTSPVFRDISAPASLWLSEPLHHHATGTGLVTMFSKWQGADKIHAAFQCGNLLDADHQLGTPGHFQIQRGKDRILCNANYEANAQWAPSGKSPFANIVIIDDGADTNQQYPFAQGQWYGTPGCRIIDFRASAEHVYAAGDYTASYRTSLGKNSAVELVRQVVYLRPNIFVVYDRIETLKPVYAKEIRWHFLPTAFVTVIENDAYVNLGQSRLAIESFSAVGINSFVAPFSQEGQSGPKPIQRITVKPGKLESKLRVLTVFQVGELNFQESPATFATGPAIDSVILSGWRVEFARDGLPVATVGQA